MCGARGGGWRGEGNSPLRAGRFGGILPKQSRRFQSCRRVWGVGVPSRTWLTKSSLVLTRIKQHGQNYTAKPAPLPTSLELTLSLHSPELCIYSPPLCFPSRSYSPGPTCTLSRRRCPVLCRPPAFSRPFADKALLPVPITQRFLLQSSLSSHLSLLMKALLKVLGSRSRPGLNFCSLLTSVSFTCLGIHRNDTLKAAEISFHQPSFAGCPAQSRDGFKR